MNKTIALICAMFLFSSCGSLGSNFVSDTIVGGKENFHVTVNVTSQETELALKKERVSRTIDFFRNYDFKDATSEILNNHPSSQDFLTRYKIRSSTQFASEFGKRFVESNEKNNAEKSLVNSYEFQQRINRFFDYASEERVELTKEILSLFGNGKIVLPDFYTDIIFKCVDFDNSDMAKKNKEDVRIKLGEVLLRSYLRMSVYAMRDFSVTELNRMIHLLKNENGTHLKLYKNLAEIHSTLKNRIESDLEKYLQTGKI